MTMMMFVPVYVDGEKVCCERKKKTASLRQTREKTTTPYNKNKNKENYNNNKENE